MLELFYLYLFIHFYKAVCTALTCVNVTCIKTWIGSAVQINHPTSDHIETQCSILLKTMLNSS